MVWVYSTLLVLNQKQSRIERLARAEQELNDLDQQLQGPRARRRSHRQLADTVGEILGRLRVVDYLTLRSGPMRSIASGRSVKDAPTKTRAIVVRPNNVCGCDGRSMNSALTTMKNPTACIRS